MFNRLIVIFQNEKSSYILNIVHHRFITRTSNA